MITENINRIEEEENRHVLFPLEERAKGELFPKVALQMPESIQGP